MERTVYDSLVQLPAAGGRLRSHVLLLPLECESYRRADVASHLRQELAKREVAFASRELIRQLGVSDACPNAVCLPRGVQLEMLSAAADAPGSALDRLDLSGWARRVCQRASVGFMNERSEDVHVYWIEPSTGERLQETRVHPGFDNTHWRNTFLGHAFEVLSEEQELLLRVNTSGDEVHVLRRTDAFVVAPRDWTSLVAYTDEFERGRAGRVKRTFTDVGFAKAPIPAEVWASLSSYFYNNRNENHTEVWSPTLPAVYVNHWQVPTRLVPMPTEKKAAWQAALMPYVSAWAGGEVLEPTAFYGMRIYGRGAKLFRHVDREHTHALSVIMNIAQGGLESDWPLVINDIDGNPHEVTLEPGELVYYESARCLHARPFPLNGSYFVNAFAHFRPIGNPEWYTEERHAASAANVWSAAHREHRSPVTRPASQGASARALRFESAADALTSLHGGTPRSISKEGDAAAIGAPEAVKQAPSSKPRTSRGLKLRADVFPSTVQLPYQGGTTDDFDDSRSGHDGSAASAPLASLTMSRLMQLAAAVGAALFCALRRRRVRPSLKERFV